jgi:hypothetical protein
MFYVNVLIVAATTLMRMKISLSVLIVAWGSISRIGIRSILFNCLIDYIEKQKVRDFFNLFILKAKELGFILSNIFVGYLTPDN